MLTELNLFSRIRAVKLHQNLILKVRYCRLLVLLCQYHYKKKKKRVRADGKFSPTVISKTFSFYLNSFIEDLGIVRVTLSYRLMRLLNSLSV